MNIGKVLFGIIALVAGVWLLVPSTACGNIVYCPGLWKDLYLVLKGIVPAALVLLGLVLIWAEAE